MELLPVNFDVYVYVARQPQGVWNVRKPHFAKLRFRRQLVDLNFVARRE
jgi:hypothetical protein